MINPEKLTFKHLIMTIGNLPSSYVESLSYYECLLWLCNYLENTVIPAVNNNASALEELQGLFTELQTYVNNYFENLDVQEEINNKLDEMFEDGSLTNLVQQQYSEITQYIDSEIDDVNDTLTANYNTLSSRITAIANESPTVVASTSDMTDETKIYINSTDLKWYYYDGTNWTAGGKYMGDSTDVDFINSYIGAYHEYSTLRPDRKSIQMDYDLYLASGQYFEFNISNIVNTEDLHSLIIYGYNAGGTPSIIKSYYDANIINHDFIKLASDTYKIRIYMETSAIDETLSAESTIILYRNTNNLTGKINNIKSSLGEYLIEQNTQRADGIFAQFDENVFTGENIYFYINNYSGTPTSFYLYGYQTAEGSPTTLYTSNNVSGLIRNTHKITTEHDYVRFRMYLGYADGRTETASFVFVHDDNTMIAKLYKMQNTINTTTNYAKDVYKIFKRVGCVGDSYTSGHIVDSGGHAHPSNPEFAWPHFMETASGNEYLNFGISGANANTWLSNSNGLAKAQQAGRCQAYIVGLGINDSSSDPSRNLTLGTSADIGTDVVSFYGKYSKIIRELHTISPDAKIFVNTVPKEDSERYDGYNEAIRYIATAYAETYNCYLLDLNDDIELFTTQTLEDDMVGGHYTALGYEQCAEILQHLLSEFIVDNISDFQEVAFIPYD